MRGGKGGKEMREGKSMGPTGVLVRAWVLQGPTGLVVRACVL